MMSMPYRLVCQALTSLTFGEKVAMVGFSMTGFGPEEQVLFQKTFIGDNAIVNFLDCLLQSSKSHLIHRRLYIFHFC